MRKTWGTRPPWGSSTLSQPSTTLDWTMSLTPLWSWCLSNSKIYGGSKRSSTMRRGYWMCVRMHSSTCKHRLSYAHTVISLSFVLSSVCLNWTHSVYFSSLSVLHIRNNYLRGSTWAVPALSRVKCCFHCRHRSLRIPRHLRPPAANSCRVITR